MAGNELGKVSQSVMIVEIRGMVQFRLVLGVVSGTCSILTVHDGEHSVDHDSLGNGGFEIRVIVSSDKLACVSGQDTDHFNAERLTVAMKLGLCTTGR